MDCQGTWHHLYHRPWDSLSQGCTKRRNSETLAHLKSGGKVEGFSSHLQNPLPGLVSAPAFSVQRKTPEYPWRNQGLTASLVGVASSSGAVWIFSPLGVYCYKWRTLKNRPMRPFQEKKRGNLLYTIISRLLLVPHHLFTLKSSNSEEKRSVVLFCCVKCIWASGCFISV